MAYTSKYLSSHTISTHLELILARISHEVTSRCELESHYSEGLARSVQVYFQDGLIHDSQLVLAQGKWPQFLIMRAIPLSNLSVLFTLQLVSPGVNDNENKAEARWLLCTNLGSHSPTFLQYLIGYTG